jgi:hypothetical protein
MSEFGLPGIAFWVYSLGLLVVGSAITHLVQSAQNHGRCADCTARVNYKSGWADGRWAGVVEGARLVAEKKKEWEADAG